MAQIQKKYDVSGNFYAYSISVYLGRDAKNKRIMRYKTVLRPENLTPRKEEREIQRIADDWERELREEYENTKDSLSEDKRKIKEKITVVSFIDNYWIEKHVKDGKHTADSIDYFTREAKSIKKYFDTEKPNQLLKKLDKEDILDFIQYFRNDALQPNGKRYSPSTVKHRYTVLRNILNYAVYLEFIRENPCQKIRKEDKPKLQAKEIDFLDEENARLFLAALDSETEKAYWQKKKFSYAYWKALVNIFLLTGLRRGELVGLQWGDLDEKNLLLHVRRNVTPDPSHKGESDPLLKISIGETKGKSIRRVPISGYVLTLLQDLRKEETDLYRKSKMKPGVDVSKLSLPNDMYIFYRPSDISLPLYPSEPTKFVKKFIKRHNLPDMSPHDLRHTAASLAIQSGANVKEIQLLLGHKDPSTTLKFYTGITEQANRGTIDGIENLLRPSEKKQPSE